MNHALSRPPGRGAGGFCHLEARDLPDPGKDVASFIKHMDLGDVFNTLCAAHPRFHVPSMQPVFRHAAVETPLHTLSEKVLPLYNPAFSPYYDHPEAFDTHTRQIERDRKAAAAAGKPFIPPPPLYPPTYYADCFAAYLKASAAVLRNANPYADWETMNLVILAPSTLVPADRPVAVVHEDAEGYRLALTLIPAPVAEPA